MRGWGTISENVSLRDKLRRVGAALLAQIHIYRLTEKPIVYLQLGGAVLPCLPK